MLPQTGHVPRGWVSDPSFLKGFVRPRPCCTTPHRATRRRVPLRGLRKNVGARLTYVGIAVAARRFPSTLPLL